MVDDKQWKNYVTGAVWEHLAYKPEASKFWKERTKALLQSNNKNYYQTIRALSVEIQSRVEKGNPIADDGSLYDELLCWTLGEVDWWDVAEEFVREEFPV